MDKINDGGAAFPVPNDANVNDQEGMTLRDYFAAKAMAAMFGNKAWGDCASRDDIAEDAYAQADAMLRAREVKS